MADSPKTGNQEFGDLLREAREDRGMSRRDLAEATGLSYPYISQLETGYRLPSPSAIQTLSRVLLVSLDAIFATITSEEPQAAPRRRAAPAATGWVENRAFGTARAGAAAGTDRPGSVSGVGAAVAGGAGSARPLPTPAAAPLMARESVVETPRGRPSAAAHSAADVVAAAMELLMRLRIDDRLHALAQIQEGVVRSTIQESAR